MDQQHNLNSRDFKSNNVFSDSSKYKMNKKKLKSSFVKSSFKASENSVSKPKTSENRVKFQLNDETVDKLPLDEVQDQTFSAGPLSGEMLSPTHN